MINSSILMYSYMSYICIAYCPGGQPGARSGVSQVVPLNMLVIAVLDTEPKLEHAVKQKVKNRKYN